MRCTKCGTESAASRKLCRARQYAVAARCEMAVRTTSRIGVLRGLWRHARSPAGSAAASSTQAASTAPIIHVTPEQHAHDPIKDERKPVTALFADIKGSIEVMEETRSGESAHDYRPGAEADDRRGAIGITVTWCNQRATEFSRRLARRPRTRTLRSGRTVRRCGCRKRRGGTRRSCA